MLKINQWQVPIHISRHIGRITHVSGTAGPPVDYILPDINAADLAIHMGDAGQIVQEGNSYPDSSRIVVGALSRAVEIRHGANINTVFISLPPGCTCLLNVSAGAVLRDVIAPLDQIAPTLDAAIGDWMDAYREGRANAQSLMDVLSENVHVQCDRVVRKVASALDDTQSHLVTSLASEYDLSRRQLDRRFGHAVGRTPREYRRIARFARAWRIAGHAPVENWAALAMAAGYFDQPHLNHDFRILATMPPKSVFSESWYTAFERRCGAAS